jgi:hypothetical protein
MGVVGSGTLVQPGRRGIGTPKKKKGDVGPNVKWVIGPHVRFDLIAYSGIDITGAQFVSQIFASGHREGTIDGARMQSLVIGAPVGQRLTLCTSMDDYDWEDSPWRCIRLVEGQTYFTQLDGTPAVRIPDLEWLDAFDAKKSNQDSQVSYPFAKTLADGKGWTFGRVGPLKNRIKMIRLEREDHPLPRAERPPEHAPAAVEAAEPEAEAAPARKAPPKKKTRK